MKCFIDYDGTLATDNGIVNSENLLFLRKHSESFVLVTGRSLAEINRIFNEKLFKIDAIGGNGSFIYKNNHIQILSTLDRMSIIKILVYLRKYNFPILLHTVKGTYLFVDYCNNSKALCKERLENIAREYANKILHVCDVSNELYELYYDTFFKIPIGQCHLDDLKKLKYVTSIEIFYDSSEEKRIFKNFLNKFGQVTESYYTSMEFNGAATKGTAVETYIKNNKINFSFSIGNGLNDESMFIKTNVAFRMAGTNQNLSAIELPFTPLDPFLPEIYECEDNKL